MYFFSNQFSLPFGETTLGSINIQLSSKKPHSFIHLNHAVVDANHCKIKITKKGTVYLTNLSSKGTFVKNTEMFQTIENGEIKELLVDDIICIGHEAQENKKFSSELMFKLKFIQNSNDEVGDSDQSYAKNCGDKSGDIETIEVLSSDSSQSDLNEISMDISEETTSTNLKSEERNKVKSLTSAVIPKLKHQKGSTRWSKKICVQIETAPLNPYDINMRFIEIYSWDVQWLFDNKVNPPINSDLIPIQTKYQNYKEYLM